MLQSSQSDHYSPGFGLDGQLRECMKVFTSKKRKKEKEMKLDWRKGNVSHKIKVLVYVFYGVLLNVTWWGLTL